MTKTFLEYLRRVEHQFRCKDLHGRSDDDRRLYMFCRIRTIADNHKAGFTCLQMAEVLNASYLRDVAGSDTWWRA